ncbi:MAG: ABC transporter permease [Armatimonadota bacterium]|nr:ABC transporter permease [Armatimonadota bacterium]
MIGELRRAAPRPQPWRRWLRRLAAAPAARTLGPFVPIVVAWALVVEAGVFPRAFFPGPLDVARAFVDLVYKGILPAYLQDSVTRLAVGAAAGIVVGVPFGLLIGLHAASYRFFWPIVIFFQAIGDIAWLPILLIWFGFTLTTMTFVIVYTVIFPVIFNTALGVRTIPPEMVRAAQSLGTPPVRILGEVLVPGALPNIITGLRNGLGYGWRALIAAEIIVGTSGIGFMMFDARRAGSVVEMILGMIVLGVLWYAVDGGLLAPLERATIERWGLTRREGER